MLSCRPSACLLVCCTVSFALSAAPAYGLAAKPNRDELLNVFDAAGIPDVAGKKFVRYNAGGRLTLTYLGHRGVLFTYVTGWVLSESEEEIAILSRYLSTHTYSRRRDVPEGWEEPDVRKPGKGPFPGEYDELDFREFCSYFIHGGDPNVSRGDWPVHETRGGLPREAEAVLFAYWADQVGMADVAARLLRHAAESFEDQYRHPRWGGMSLPEFVCHHVAANLRWQAIEEANRGVERRELLKKWQVIARKLPENDFTEEAKELCRFYGEMTEEDERWTEPTEGELARMTPAERAVYWLHRLRDQASIQWSQPGRCRVVGRPGPRGEGPRPADELVKLGWDALPVVIEHLDDPRPTRSVAFWRAYAKGSYYLLRYGDCCQQVFEAITGYDIYQRMTTSGYPVPDGVADVCKRAALEWWETNRRPTEAE